MNKVAKNVLDTISSTVKENPKTIAALVAGAGIGGLGGGLASAKKEDPKESKGGRRMRILRNALLGGTAGAGAAGLGMLGYKQLSNALPEGDTDPATHIFTSPLGRGLMGGAAGGAGWMASAGKRESEAGGFLRSLRIQTEKGQARTTLKNLMDQAHGNPLEKLPEYSASFLNKLDGNPIAARKGLMSAGIDPHQYGYGDYRFSDKLPEKMRNKYRKGTGFVADKIKGLPGVKGRDLSQLSGARKTLSRAAYRHPAIAALIAGGVMAPEALDVASTLTGPIAPDILHR